MVEDLSLVIVNQKIQPKHNKIAIATGETAPFSDDTVLPSAFDARKTPASRAPSFGRRSWRVTTEWPWWSLRARWQDDLARWMTALDGSYIAWLWWYTQLFTFSNGLRLWFTIWNGKPMLLFLFFNHQWNGVNSLVGFVTISLWMVGKWLGWVCRPSEAENPWYRFLLKPYRWNGGGVL